MGSSSTARIYHLVVSGYHAEFSGCAAWKVLTQVKRRCINMSTVSQAPSLLLGGGEVGSTTEMYRLAMLGCTKFDRSIGKSAKIADIIIWAYGPLFCVRSGLGSLNTLPWTRYCATFDRCSVTLPTQWSNLWSEILSVCRNPYKKLRAPYKINVF